MICYVKWILWGAVSSRQTPRPRPAHYSQYISFLIRALAVCVTSRPTFARCFVGGELHCLSCSTLIVRFSGTSPRWEVASSNITARLEETINKNDEIPRSGPSSCFARVPCGEMVTNAGARIGSFDLTRFACALSRPWKSNGAV